MKFTRSYAISLQVGIQPHSVADPDPHHFGKLDSDPQQNEKLDRIRMQALEGHFGALEGPSLEKSECRIRIRIPIKL
jgi:hypothetical protein